ncbi:MAG: hypothetical protein ACJ78Q_00530 [Chloroflexia bacterium]
MGNDIQILRRSSVARVYVVRRIRQGTRYWPLLWAVGVGLGLATWLYIVWAYKGQPGDDPYITYRYAYNLVAGNGFVFNAGERVQSTTAPLFTMLLALGGYAGFDIPALGYAFSVMCLLAFAVCCVGYLSSADRQLTWPAAAAATLTFVCPVTTFGLGTEMPLLVALSWASWWAFASRRWAACALLAGLAALTRGDGLLVGVAVALVFVWTHRGVPLPRWPWHAPLLYLLAVGPWYLFAWLYFGSPLPATLGAKVAQGSARGTVTFFEGLGYFWTHSLGNQAALWLPALALLAVGLVGIVRRGSALALPLVWSALFIAGFSLLHVPRYPWYYSPLVPVAMVALVIGGGLTASLTVGASRRTMPRPSWPLWPLTEGQTQAAVRTSFALAAACLVGAIYLWQDVATPRPQMAPRSQLYVSIGRWLAANTSQGATVGAEEVGLLGYYSGRDIIDFVGLLQPDVASRRAAGDNLWAVETYRPEYIVAMPAWLSAVGEQPWVREHYAPLRTFTWPGSDQATLLQRKPGGGKSKK